MKSKLIRKALTLCSLAALTMTYSMVALANSAKAVGELTVSGNNTPNNTIFVTVNGEPAQSGRTVLASSTISVPDGMSATVNFGKAGKLHFGPNTTFVLGSDTGSITGDLTSGTVTVLGAAKSVGVRTLAGDVVQLDAGESATATSSSSASRHSNYGSGDWWMYALIFGGAAAALIFIATGNNDTNLGGSAVAPSPIR
jgi:hypothetical protein